jgi:hypothetical protein
MRLERCEAVRSEEQNGCAAYHRAAAAHNDGGVLQETFDQMLPYVFLSLIIESTDWVV